MSTSIARTSAIRRLGRSLASVGATMIDAIEANRAFHSTHTAEGRRAVLDRFAADLRA